MRFSGNAKMTTTNNRIEPAFSQTSYDRALSVVEKTQIVQAKRNSDLSLDDLTLGEKFLEDHSGWVNKHIKKAQAHTAGINFRHLSPKEQL